VRRYREDPTYRARQIAENAQRRRDPAYRRRENAWARERRHRDPIRWLWFRAKHRAREKSIEFTITLDDVQREWSERCPVFGIPWGNTRAQRPSLDRLNPKLGYVSGNIAVISGKANLIKSNATGREVELVARWMRHRGL